MGALQCFKVNVDETTTEIKTEGALKEKLNAEECYVIVSDKYICDHSHPFRWDSFFYKIAVRS